MEFGIQRTVGSNNVVSMDFNPWGMIKNKLEFHRNGAYDFWSDLGMAHRSFHWNSEA